jgi:hypothetical protein
MCYRHIFATVLWATFGLLTGVGLAVIAAYVALLGSVAAQAVLVVVLLVGLAVVTHTTTGGRHVPPQA